MLIKFFYPEKDLAVNSQILRNFKILEKLLNGLYCDVAICVNE